MDVERMALQVRRAGEVDVRGGAANKARATWRSATTAIRDLQRDWQRWSAAERVCAIALGGLWAAGLTMAILADTHLL
jgi:hypothetical protein